MDALTVPARGLGSWRFYSLCSEAANTKLFFPVGVTGKAEVQIEQAKEVCSTCPVKDECLEYALTTNQEYGIWGGKSEEDRRVIRRQRRVQRKALAAAAAAEKKAS